MNTNQFDKIFKEGVYHHEEVAPDLMPKIFERRTAWYIFTNKLLIHKFKLAGVLAIGILALLFTWVLNDNSNPSNSNFVQNSTGVEQNVSSESDINGLVNDSKLADTQKQNELGVDQNAAKPIIAKQNSTRNGTKSSVPKPPKFVVENGSIGNQGAPKSDKSSTTPYTPKTDEVVEQEIAQTESKPTEEPNSEVTQDKEKEVSEPVVAQTEVEMEESMDSPKTDFEETPKSNVPLKKWSVLVSAGPAYAYRRLESKSSPDIVALRNGSESAKLSHQSSILAHFEIQPGFEIYSGINWLQRREQMEYVKTTTFVNTTIKSHEVIEYHPILPPKRITIYDTAHQQMEVKSNESRQNSYTHITIPVGFRFSAYGNKLGYHISVDGAMQIASLNKGSVMHNQSEELDLTAPDYKRKQVGYSASGSFGVSYLMTNRWSLVSEYRATYFLSPTNGSGYQINQYDFGHGLLFGMKYRF